MSTAPPPSPAHAPARIARNAVETVLFSIREIPLEFDRPAVATRLESAIHWLYASLDSDLDAPAHFEGLSEAAKVIAEARELLLRAGDPNAVPALHRAVYILQNALQQSSAAAEQVAELQLLRRMTMRRAPADDGAPKPRPFRASVGVPELHSLARRPLAAHVSIAPIVELSASPVAPSPRVPKPTTFEALEAFAEAASSGALARELLADPPYDDGDEVTLVDHMEPAYHPRVEEGDALRRLARDCLEDIASLGMLRKPIPTETWLDQEPFEQRLLNNLDCFASLGGVGLPLAALYHAEAEAPDPPRGFALAFTLGCIDGSDTIDAAIAALKQSPPEEHAAFAEGFALASSPAIDRAFVDLLGHPSGPLAGVALDVLAARGALPADAPAWISARNDAALARKLARALGTNLPKAQAIATLLAMWPNADDALFLVVAESLLRRGYGPAREVLRVAIEAPPTAMRGEGAAWLLCLSTHPEDLDALLRFVQAHPSPRALRGLGRFGHADAMPTLIHFLTATDDAPLVASAAEALDRMTGAGLREIVEEPWELGLPPSARIFNPADPDLARPMRSVERAVRDPARWEAYKNDEGQKLDRRKKWRAGRPFVPAHIVDELEAKATSPSRREEAALELVISTALATPFSPADWVVRQRKHLRELRELANSARLPAGAWCFAGSVVGVP